MEEILNDLKEIKELLRIIASNTEQDSYYPLSRFKGMTLKEIEDYYAELGEKYSSQ